jgi:dTDP-4-dehydrorhamnose 3,5-epimerase
MKIKQKLFEGCCLYEQQRFFDDRGFFQEVYRQNEEVYQGDETWPQVSYSESRKNVVRGLHCSPYKKQVQCLRGRLFDVVVDLREDSETYKEWFGVWLSEGVGDSLLIPANCAHGFYSAEDDTILMYLQGGVWQPNQDKEYHYTSFGIQWPKIADLIVSEKDAAAVYKV